MREDEFIRKRKARQKKAKRRRRIRLAVFSAFLALAVLCVLAFTVMFPVRTVEITGTDRYEAQQVMDAGGIKIGDNILRISEKKCEELLRQKLPYVKSVRFRKRLSGKLTLAVTEEAETEAYLFEKQYYLVGDGGHILGAAKKAPDGIPVIVAEIKKPVPGETIVLTSEKAGKAMQEIVDAVTSCGLTLNMLDIRKEFEISMKVEGRFSVTLGTGNYLDKKIRHLAAMLKEIDPDKTGKVDLSMWSPDHTQGVFVEKNVK